MEGARVLSVAGLLIWLAGSVNCQQSSNTSLANINCSDLDKFKVDDFDDVYIRFFWGSDTAEPGKNKSVPFRRYTELVNDEKFDNSRCVITVVGAWNTENNNPRLLNLVNGFLNTNNSNVIQLLWASVTVGKPYEESAALGNYLAPMLAEVMDDSMDAGVPCIHFMGHGLGGQLIAATSRVMKKKVERLIALDPSSVLYTELQNCFESLRKDDAECTTVIHTDAGGLGIAGPSAMIDYWVNNGSRPQPGCSELSILELYPGDETQISDCSHNRALDITTESIFELRNVLAVPCSSWDAFEAGECSNSTGLFLNGCRRNVAPGNYYFRTSDSPPYGLGKEGTRP